MIKRTLDISEPAYLHLKHQQLLIDKKGESIAQIPIEDLGVVILQNPAIVITQAVIIACQKNNVVLVFCDERHLPYSVLLPISDGNNLHNAGSRYFCESIFGLPCPKKRQKLRDRSCLRLPQPSCFTR